MISLDYQEDERVIWSDSFISLHLLCEHCSGEDEHSDHNETFIRPMWSSNFFHKLTLMYWIICTLFMKKTHVQNAKSI